MQKISKPQYGLEEELFITIFRLFEKKTSKIFREPVDQLTLPDYYQKIKYPIDLQTIQNKIKNGRYRYANEVKEDLDQIIRNCRQYNQQLELLKTAEKFEKSIQTEWGNFEKELKKKCIDIDTKIKIDEDIKKRLTQIEDKISNKRPSNLQMNLIETDKRGQSEFKILPPLNPELFLNNATENDLPKQLEYRPIKYFSLNMKQKQNIMSVKLNKQTISKSFDDLCEKKVEKYKKILFKKIMWIQDKIIQRCLERKRFNKMTTCKYLSNYIEKGEIANNLQLRKIQMYVKQVAYWIQEYPQILTYPMKNRFIQTCKAIRRCIFRVLRYKKIAAKFTKIQIDFGNGEHNQVAESKEVKFGESQQQQIGEEESKRYDNEIKSFKRLLSKDQGETIKKYTKIMIKNQNGEFSLIDWNSENNQKKFKSSGNRNLNISRPTQNTEEIQRVEKQKEKKEERQKDEVFLRDYKNKSNLEIISHYQEKLSIDWDEIFLSKVPIFLPFVKTTTFIGKELKSIN